MGAEIGISTDKIGARGPMGLEELTSYKWLGIGSGQISETKTDQQLGGFGRTFKSNQNGV
jgi:hypothetical protein